MYEFMDAVRMHAVIMIETCSKYHGSKGPLNALLLAEEFSVN